MKSYIYKNVETIIKEYHNNPKRISSDYNREKEAIEVYRGRELLELIQNADDELTDDQSKEIRITFIQGKLTVSNNGSPFSEQGIDSLMYTNISAKSKKRNMIGNKGTGFRAILGWAREINIKSGNLSIRFSDHYSQKILKQILATSAYHQDGYRSATLVFPEWLEDEEKSLYTTDVSIIISNDEAIVTDINKQLEDIDGELLLFLNRAEELVVVVEGREIKFKKKIINSEHIVIEKYINAILIDKQEWIMNRKSGVFEDKEYSIVIAYNPKGLSKKKQVVYSYFPTDVEFPFPVLLHATFNLNSDRNHLIKADKANKYILEEAGKLFIETAVHLTKNEVSYNALSILTPQKSISKELSDYGFEENLLRLIKKAIFFQLLIIHIYLSKKNRNSINQTYQYS